LAAVKHWSHRQSEEALYYTDWLTPRSRDLRES
jgi:hypothetical protein